MIHDELKVIQAAFKHSFKTTEKSYDFIFSPTKF